MTKMSAVAVVLGLALTTSVFADSSASTDWYLGLGGLYSYAGGSSPLVGSNIPIESVTGDKTPSKNGVSLNIVNGLLDFTSGAANGAWSWGAGAPGTLKIYGCIPGVTLNCNPSTNLLLDDDFQSVSIVQSVGMIDVVFGNVTGVIEQSVATYYGLPTNTFSTGSFSAVILTTGSPGKSFVGINLDGVLKADPPVRAPENWSLGDSFSFLAVGLIAFCGLTRSGLLKSHLLARAQKA